MVMMADEFQPGDLVILNDTRGRRYLIDLSDGGEFHSHAGVLAHAEIVGRLPGTRLRSSGGKTFRVHRPTLPEFVLTMKRGAQVIYPKDAGAIITWADIFPGARVVEAGIGSGGLTLALLRAVGPSGHLTSYELREDHAAQALRNIERYVGEPPPNHECRIGDVATDLDLVGIDRVVLDLPEPWRTVSSVREALVPGGLVAIYLPTVPQVQTAVGAFEADEFEVMETFEVMHRGWNIAGRSVRPEHRMVGHTGFITIARRISP